MEKYQHYTLFADLLRYPGDDYTKRGADCLAMLQERYPEAAKEMLPFLEYMNTHTQDEREELYTKTFDVQPICYLDLGFVIFGEDYKRGAFLLHMQQEQRKAGNDCGTDLSDNISNVLVWYTKTDNQTLAEELAVRILIPGVEKMISEFAQARIDLKVKVLKKMHRAIIQEELNRENVFRNLFSALVYMLKKDFSHVHFEAVTGPIPNLQHHKAFIEKQGVNTTAPYMTNTEVNDLVNNYKLD
ncbi:MAG: hypothetical protein IT233_01535 [Bacteroidia bacterium]|nr:hypothetical protein [Bacteroidia bacterium]